MTATVLEPMTLVYPQTTPVGPYSELYPSIPSAPPASLQAGESQFPQLMSFSQVTQTQYQTSKDGFFIIRIWRWLTSSDELHGKYGESLKKIQELEMNLRDAQEKTIQLQALNQSLNQTLVERDSSIQILQTSNQQLSSRALQCESDKEYLATTNARLENERNLALNSLALVTDEKNRLTDMKSALATGFITERERVLTEKVKVVSSENTQLKAKIAEIEKLYRMAKEREGKLQLDVNGLKQSLEVLQSSKEDIQAALVKEQRANQQLIRTIPKIATQVPS